MEPYMLILNYTHVLNALKMEGIESVSLKCYPQNLTNVKTITLHVSQTINLLRMRQLMKKHQALGEYSRINGNYIQITYTIDGLAEEQFKKD